MSPGEEREHLQQGSLRRRDTAAAPVGADRLCPGEKQLKNKYPIFQKPAALRVGTRGLFSHD